MNELPESTMRICEQTAQIFYWDGGYKWSTLQDLRQYAYCAALELRAQGKNLSEGSLHWTIRNRLIDVYQKETKARSFRRRGKELPVVISMNSGISVTNNTTNVGAAVDNEYLRQWRDDKRSREYGFIIDGRRYAIDCEELRELYEKALAQQQEWVARIIREYYEKGEHVVDIAKGADVTVDVVYRRLKRFRNFLRSLIKEVVQCQ